MNFDQTVLQKAKAVLGEAEYKRFFQAWKSLEKEKIPLKKTSVMVQQIVSMLPDFDLLMASLFVQKKDVPDALVNRYLNEFQKNILSKIIQLSDPFLMLPEGRQDLIHLLFEAFVKENRILYYFLADLHAQSKVVQNLSALEKIEFAQILFSVAAPLAYRLGLHDIKESFESASFALLFHSEYSDLEAQRNEYIKKEHIFLRRVVGKIRYFLKKNSIPFTIKSRVKNIYSIYRKLKKKGRMHLSALHDIFAVRIIVPEPLQCYMVLGMLHQNFPYMPGKIKDYISKPKTNAYQSLHTTLEVPFEQGVLPVEIQMRTEEMNAVATSGIAAHLLYKKQTYGKNIDSKKELKKKMAELLSYFSEKSFLQSAEEDIFSQHIFVFGKDQKIFPLTKGATVLDFAYTIHTDLGNHTTGAMVNGKPVGIEYRLHNGDEVLVSESSITQREEHWIRIARMPSVRKTIRSYYHQEE